jgi:glutamate racemase
MAAVSTPPPAPNERPIAVFDSGVGGLTVLQELLVELPHEDFLYLGDTARFPYGERSARELEAARSCSSSPATLPARPRSMRCASGCSRPPSVCMSPV